MTIEIDPLLPLWLIIVLGAGLAVSALLRLRMAPVGAVLRLLFGAAVVLFLLGPETVRQTFDGLPDQALILLDESASMDLAGRAAIRDESAEELRRRLEDEGLDVITARFGDQEASEIGAGLTEALSGTERAQISGVFVLTDGQVEGLEEALAAEVPAPIHTLVTGDPETDRDRRLSWVTTPRFGLVGEDVRLQFRIDSTENEVSLPITLRVDGQPVLERSVQTGETVTIDLPVERPGERIVDLQIPAMEDELTTRNNSVSAKVNVIRDRLRVLLISGEPHAGERVWRNVLKSDPAVDLVHFTILKPAEKIAPAGPGELNLIPFPSTELFLDKLEHFNVVIFDRYTYRGVITSFELAEVSRYVERGGAVLIAAGPELTSEGSLAAQPNLSYILPATPIGVASERPFIPARTEVGSRHPITSELEDAEEWGRWLRKIPAAARRGSVLMEAGDGEPLLVTDRVGEGRIAMLLSDHLWLWARGFDGGGPHREFLRRLVHWLMAEPELEEEALRASLSDEGVLSVDRQSLSDDVGMVIAEADGAALDPLALEPTGNGHFGGTIEGIEADLVRVMTTTSDGRVLNAAAVRERGAPREFSAVTLNPGGLDLLNQATGGGEAILAAGRSDLPQLRRVRQGREEKSGRGWLGLVERNARAVLSEAREPALPRWLYAVAAGGLLLGAWLVESDRLKRRQRTTGSAPSGAVPSAA